MSETIAKKKATKKPKSTHKRISMATAKKSVKKYTTLTLEEIEKTSTELVLNMNRENFFIATKKIEALNLIANQKIQRMKLEAMREERAGGTAKPEPIKVEFVSASTIDSQLRIDKLTEEVENSISISSGNEKKCLM